ncbi:hypothetical protein GCM10023187_51350 [Nibrella viscosa]|uniref:PKD domain-containing protein n=1 Tax=Nibrella viscosa TaxID=1084524 RepID=A0ABP8KWL5_9BACT
MNTNTTYAGFGFTGNSGNHRRLTLTGIIGLLLCYWLPISLVAQPAIEWDRTLGGGGIDNLTCIQLTADGGYILGGSSTSGAGTDKSENSKGGADYWIVKLRANGTKEWDKTIGGNRVDVLHYVRQTPDGGYLLLGNSLSDAGFDKSENPLMTDPTADPDSDGWVVKLRADGTIEWDNTLGGGDVDQLYAVALTTDGGYLVAGSSNSNAGFDKSQNRKGDFDYWVVKLRADGSKEWDKTIGGAGSDQCNALLLTADGGYMLGGTSDSNAGSDKSENRKGDLDYWVVKVRADGTIEWDKTLGGASWENLASLEATADGGYIVAGTSASNAGFDKTQNLIAGTGADYWVVKLRADGSIAWDKTIGGAGFDVLQSVRPTADGGFILGGYSDSNAGYNKSENRNGILEDYWVVKLRTDGTIEWDKTMGGGSSDRLSLVLPTPDGGYIAGGSSMSSVGFDKSEAGRGGNDYWVVKLKSACIPPGVPIIRTVSATNEPVPVNTDFAVMATTPDATITTAVWDWGDGTTSGGRINNSAIQGNHVYTASGVFTIRLTVGNACGLTAENVYQYVVVYDSNGGFVTGGGTIYSPAGSYKRDLTANGTATFGFVAKYQPGATVPSGTTQFKFIAGNFHFVSTAYQWLVVAGAKAQFKGEGTRNGSGYYGFMLTAIDADLTGSGGTDRFRIKIWDKANGDQIVYDNNAGADDGAEPVTALTSGNIKIQSSTGKRNREGYGTAPELRTHTLFLSNYPNPIDGKATFEFMLPQGGAYRLDIVDLTGNLIQHVQSGSAQAGEHRQVTLEQVHIPSGVYISRLLTEQGMKTTKLIVR